MEERNILVEIPLNDGRMSMYVGRLVSRTTETITLVDAAWVADTGRMHRFFAGDFDTHVEIEPYPDGVTIELPATGALVYDWPHPLLREAR